MIERLYTESPCLGANYRRQLKDEDRSLDFWYGPADRGRLPPVKYPHNAFALGGRWVCADCGIPGQISSEEPMSGFPTGYDA